ncbi:hypothetical protein [Nocardioides sp. InS609-2]|uniref:hypothetical protein n=1 Tax=Nocardioides sp. InS609-2 TaxID=2760705 RepID=UPI0020C05CD4|nr:hypothetical protein [Nocardioides sp. InS609-2]
MAMCRHHVGKALDVARTQGEANLLAWSSAAASGRTLAAMDPGQVVMDQLRVAVLRADIYGELLRLQVADEDAWGLVGPTYAVGRDGGARVETGERVRGLAALEAEWRDRVVRFAKAAHDMGIAEQHIQLEQDKAQLVTSAFMAALAVVVLVPGDRDLMLRAFLEGLGRGPVVGGALEGGAS